MTTEKYSPPVVHHVPFHDTTLVAQAGDKPENVLVAMKPIVRGMGLTWQSQHVKIQSNQILSEGVTKLVIPSAGGPQETVALPLTLLPFWLTTLSPNQIRNPDIRAKVILYQREAAAVLFEHFFGAPAEPEVAGGEIVRSDGELSEATRKVIGGIVKSCTGVVIAKQQAEIADLTSKLEAVTKVTRGIYEILQALDARKAPAIYRSGRTSGQIWRDYGFPRIRIGAWFSNLLRKMGCQVEGGGRGELGLTRAYLFDPDKVEVWMDEGGGRLIVEHKLAERRNRAPQHQHALTLVPFAKPEPKPDAPAPV